MPILPALTLLGNITSSSSYAQWTEDDGWQDSDYQWQVTINIQPQPQSSNYTPTPFYYTGDDVKIGMWIGCVADSKSVKIINIISHAFDSITVIVEDVDRYNTQSDFNQGGYGFSGSGTVLMKVNRSGQSWRTLTRLSFI
jgi:hypothetical protein